MSRAPEWVSILRDPGEVAQRCVDEDELTPLARTSMGAIVIGACVLGGVLGSFRGGAQIALAAVKLPLVLLLSLCIAAPAFYALANALGKPWTFRTVVALSLAASARAAMVMAALAPALWLAMDLGLGYHGATLAAVLVVALGGSLGAGLLLRALGTTVSGVTSGLACAVVFLAVLAQTTWMARPFLVRPRAEGVIVVRDVEGTFLEAIGTSTRSARGLYDAPEAALPDAPAAGAFARELHR